VRDVTLRIEREAKRDGGVALSDEEVQQRVWQALKAKGYTTRRTAIHSRLDDDVASVYTRAGGSGERFSTSVAEARAAWAAAAPVMRAKSAAHTTYFPAPKRWSICVTRSFNH